MISALDTKSLNITKSNTAKEPDASSMLNKDQLATATKAVVRWLHSMLNIKDPKILFVGGSYEDINNNKAKMQLIAPMIGLSNWKAPNLFGTAHGNDVLADMLFKLCYHVSHGGAPWISPKFVLPEYKDVVVVLYCTTPHTNQHIITIINGKINGFVFENNGYHQSTDDYKRSVIEYYNDRANGVAIYLDKDDNEIGRGYYGNGLMNGIFTFHHSSKNARLTCISGYFHKVFDVIITEYWIEGILSDAKSYEEYRIKIKQQIDQNSNLYLDIATVISSYL